MHSGHCRQMGHKRHAEKSLLNDQIATPDHTIKWRPQVDVLIFCCDDGHNQKWYTMRSVVPQPQQPQSCTQQHNAGQHAWRVSCNAATNTWLTLQHSTGAESRAMYAMAPTCWPYGCLQTGVTGAHDSSMTCHNRRHCWWITGHAH